MEKLRPFYVIPSLAGTVGEMRWHPPEADATYISLAASLNALARPDCVYRNAEDIRYGIS
jgi:hypothetical protein